MGTFLTQRNSMYVSIYGDITAEQIPNEIVRLNGDSSCTVKKLTRKERVSVFKVTGTTCRKTGANHPTCGRVRKCYANDVKKEAAKGR